MMIRNHPHPGEMLRELVFEPLGMPVTQAAAHLGMSRPALSRVLNGHAGISPDLAIRLELAGASNARFWLGLQTQYDLWRARRQPQPTIQPLPGVPEPV